MSTPSRQATEPSRALVESIDGYGIATVDAAGLVATWNAGAERQFGYRAEEIVGRPITTLLPALDQATPRPRAKAAGPHEAEHRAVRRDGASFRVLVTSSPLTGASGHDAGYSIVTRALEAGAESPWTPDRGDTRYRVLFERAPIGILHADARGTYLDANERACAMLGYTRDELVGRDAGDIVGAEEVPHIEAALSDIRESPGHHREWWFRRKDGSRFRGDVVGSRLPDGTMLGMIRDVTELRAREREVGRLARLYAALSHVNQAIVRTSSREELFQQVCRALVDHGGFRMAWIGWPDAETRRLRPVASYGDEHGYLDTVEITADDRPEGRGPTGTAFRTDRPYICNDLLGDPSTAPWRAQLERHGFRSSAAFPIHAGGAVGGTLSVYGGQPDIFFSREVALLTETAADLSFALANFERDAARQAAERTALHEQQFTATMIESQPGIVYFYDSSRRFLRWNTNFETVSGYSAAEIAAMHPLDLFSGDDRAAVERSIAEVFATGEASIDAALVAKDGTATPYHFTGRRVRFKGTDCLVGVGIDLTERRNAEVRLTESERKYRELVQSANSIILRWNPAGQVMFLNEFGQRFFGYTEDEIVGRHVNGTLVPIAESTGRDLWQLMDDVLAAPETFEQNVNECQRRNGERVWVAWTNRVKRDASGRLLEILSVGSDITERRRAEVRLREAELRYHTLFEQTPVGVVIIDPATGSVVESNLQAALPLGYTLEEFGRLSLADVELIDPRGDAGRRIGTLLNGERTQFETRLRTRQGEPLDVFVSGQSIELAGRRLIHCIVVDISERIVAESERQKRERAEAADRIKSAFLATMSHELRTPLNAIIGFTGVLLQRLAGPLNDEQHKQLDMVRSSARHLLALVNDVLDISKIEAGQLDVARTPFEVRRSIDKAVAVVAPGAARAGLTLRAEISAEVGVVVADERRFEQILLNLLGNAVKFTERGEVVVTAEVVENVSSPDESTGRRWLRVRVTDTGIGIRPEDLATLFQPFRQIDSGLSRKYDGTGLGLAICSRLAELMGGRMEADSTWGVGSTFAVTLPLHAGAR